MAGQYEYPEDGRLPVLAYNAVSEVPATGFFDACWIEIWPENPALDELLTFPIRSNGTISPDETPKIQQLNASEGTAFDGSQRLERIPSWFFLVASVVSGALIGFALIWTRRLQLASTLHAGVHKISLSVQMTTETAIFALPAAALSLGLGLLVAMLDNPGSPWPAYFSGSGVIAAGIAAALVATAGATLSISESRLFRYFKSR